MKVSLIAVTDPTDPAKTAEDLIVYTARVSSPQNQDDLGTGARLLKYLIKHKHWSPFEMVDMTVEIETSRAIAAQILRHKSFSFQEFSQRYATVFNTYEPVRARRQDLANRQNSIDDLDEETKNWFMTEQARLFDESRVAYSQALSLGIAKECARFLLPLSVATRLYMKGSVRSWIHYFETRCAPSTQLEHRELANEILKVFSEQFPVTAAAIW